jgi:glutathione S-transferase
MPPFHQHGSETKSVPSGPPDVSQGLHFFGNRICPFANRGWAALLENGFQIHQDFAYHHIGLGKEKPAWYKESVFSEGTVPCLFKDGVIVAPGSEAIVDWAWENSRVPEAERPLRTPAGDETARVKTLLEVISPSYKVLMAKEGPVPEDALAAIKAGYDAWEKAYSGGGPFLFGPRISNADLLILPFVDRFCATLLHYRQFDLLSSRPALSRALNAALERSSFGATAQPRDFYVWAYRGYALTDAQIAALGD